ncbi:SHOCT domain-containing protein [Cryobacterium adonitolivorans]|uniref:SHOCT domain-containing protein n=1 Tax=Cryobacterium adonitolivorans TaxID=1259189 RepID=A0A4R8VZS4_9MICO|nr:SHOCT domain-containing protein [Cryobacterium adonitolivorans]TFB97517.1 SHOCT domain-containing protein [Cryobacterium adonitolivorans]
MMWGYGWDMGWSWLLGLVVLIGIVLLVILTVRIFSGRSNQGNDSGSTQMSTSLSSARQILDERYARGELTSEQYREQIQILGEFRR